jgi:hypothetical protein
MVSLYLATAGVACNRVQILAIADKIGMRWRYPTDLDTLLTRAALADALTKAGYPTARATLAMRATRGGGPRYRLFGRVPLYRWGDALEWVRSRLGRVVRSTSELDGRRPRRSPEKVGEPAQMLPTSKLEVRP